MQENEKRTITQICKRRVCEICGAPATYRLTFLLPNARSNPASSGYGKDDISWCKDGEAFVCDKHNNSERNKIANELGMKWCASFPFNDRWKHLFLFWETVPSKEGS